MSNPETNSEIQEQSQQVEQPNNAEQLETHSEIDQGVLNAYERFHELGPQVGTAEILSKDNNESVKIAVRAEQQDGMTVFNLEDESGLKVGFANLTEYRQGDLEKLESEKSSVHPNHEKIHYGLENQNKYEPKVYIEAMKNLRGDVYKDVGKALHEIAVERSFQIGAQGKVQLTVGGLGSGMSHTETPGTSAGFHESFGFLGQDVYNPDGSLHHSGQEINQKLAESVWDEAKLNQTIAKSLDKDGKTNTARKYWPPKGSVKADTQFLSADRPEMYLPDEIIEREKERMETSPILQVNDATMVALMEKHKLLLKLEIKKDRENRQREESLERDSHALSSIRDELGIEKQS